MISSLTHVAKDGQELSLVATAVDEMVATAVHEMAAGDRYVAARVG